MLGWLHELSNAQIGFSIAAFGLMFSTLLPYWIRRHFKVEPSESVAKGSEESFKLLISLTMLMLAFCLVRVQGDHRSAEDIVAREGTLIVKLNKALISFDSLEANAIQKTLKSYGESVIQDEWILLSKQQRSEKTSAFIRELLKSGKQLEPKNPMQQSVRSEITATIIQLSDLREARLAASHLSLPDFYWAAIGGALGVLLFFGALQAPLKKMVFYVGGVTCGVALLLTMLITVEGLFVGESQVTAAPIIRAMVQISGR
jgi:hypothetical protein